MPLDRRSFLKHAGLAAAATQFPLLTFAQEQRRIGPNDTIQVALIGAGGRGQSITRNALSVPGVKLLAVADCYDGRLAHSKEVFGADVMTTRDYKEILARKDIDAVIIATPDHWHRQASLDAMAAGKDVYCEKPMIHEYADGPLMIESAKKHSRILQVGSQRVSNIAYTKAKELLASGAIGKLNMVQAHWDRNSAQGAWEYTVPLDASTQTCDWPRFQGSAPKHAWDAERFFQWRKYKDYGTGVAGDLFVHLFSGTHFITGSHGPTKAYATGGLRFWKDGRDVPDVLLGLFDYSGPGGDWNLELRVNFVDGGAEGEGFTFTGSEGTLEINGKGLILNRVPREKGPGMSIDSFTLGMQKQLRDDYLKKHPEDPRNTITDNTTETYLLPNGYNDTVDHFRNFFSSMRTRQEPVEDATFGYRAAGAALLCLASLEKGTAVRWDPEAMKMKS
ncbi:putative dehydrogenase [Terriglobus roseus DSM 18391]|uniref:Putative dehydrogenase n=1 Tax=Terriglobus roseus (strain DSM 18391 / NRRL B-41598 / KBS 63) TaxID=926566 RepID=I3ZL52_TERRK|nr:Gfo/Idh/MocA family oxidoreductase [Terriglobus roseus]AFL89970.1 putative dehydrogenase [Terriglobus roseus DSM 18391]